MDLTFSPEQIAMADVVGDLVIEWAARPPSAKERWNAVSEIGLDTALAPEEADGLGLALCDLLPTLLALGPAAPDWPWAATIVVGPALARLMNSASEPTEPTGVAVIVPTATAPRVAHADRLTQIAVITDHAGTLLSTDHWRPTEHRDLVGEVRWWELADAHTIGLEPAPFAPDALAAGRVAEAAVLLGVGNHALGLAVGYAKERMQFGTPIGAFQAVKHMLAEARTELAFAEPVVVGAAVSVDHPCPQTHRDASLALRTTAHAAIRAVRTAIQVHGGMGYTDEVPLGRLLAAATHSQSAWGGAARLSDEITEALAVDGSPIGGAQPSLPTSNVPIWRQRLEKAES